MIRRSFLIITLVLTVLLLATLPVAADTPPQGVIQGTIVNGTTGVLPAQPLTATLKAYLNGDINNTLTDQASANGSFSFSGLNTSSDYTYQIQVDYAGVTFTGDQLAFTSNQTAISTTMDIYETTDNLSDLSISMGHIVVYSADLTTDTTSSSDINVTEVYYITNNSDQAYTGQISFGLPKDATPTDMGADLSWSTVGTTPAVVDNSPIPPGQTQIDFTYSLAPADSYTLSRSIDLPIAQMDVLVQSGLFTLSSPQLTQAAAQSMGGASFDDYTSDAIQAGEQLNIVLTKGTAASSNTLGVWLAVIGAIILIGAGIFFFRRRSNRTVPAYAGPGEAARSDRWDELLDELAALDDQRDAGTISEEDYRTARDRAKAELKEIMGRESDRGGD